MLTGELRNKVDSLWEIFWTGGLANPLDVIEQMTLDNTDTLLIFYDMHRYDKLEKEVKPAIVKKFAREDK